VIYEKKSLKIENKSFQSEVTFLKIYSYSFNNNWNFRFSSQSKIYKIAKKFL